MTEPPSPNQESAAEVRFGAWLREQRELRGIDLAYVVTFTRLSHGQIEALEGGDWDRFAASVYLRGAVMNYARAIGADVEDILSRLQIEVPGAFVAEAGADAPLPNALTAPEARSHRPMLLIGVVAAVALLGLLFWAALERERAGEVPAGKNAAQAESTATLPITAPLAGTAVTSNADVRAPDASTSGTDAKPPVAAVAPVPEPHRIQLRAGADSWVEVQADDGPPKNLVLRKGRRLKVEAFREARIRAGNAGGVTIVVDGSVLAAPMGPAGAVREKRLNFE
ncbi:MAG: helix-turn-helix domain-containing protein [Candidatus Dadabacteria bacterium]|nr:MAG: helix-turn-helix domain-containing protein [Candidatus Dadabacteria bacterium]